MSWTFLSDTRPKGRKDHLCCLCEQRIEKGIVHVARRGIGEDGPVTTRMHIYCESVSRSWDEYQWGCQDPGEFRSEEIEPFGPVDLNKKREKQ